MPKTHLGKWSFGLIVAFFVLLVVAQFVVAATGGGGETFADNLPVSLTMLAVWGTGIAAFVTGLLAIIRQRERSWLAYIAAFIGFLMLVFVLGELFGPDH